MALIIGLGGGRRPGGGGGTDPALNEELERTVNGFLDDEPSEEWVKITDIPIGTNLKGATVKVVNLDKPVNMMGMSSNEFAAVDIGNMEDLSNSTRMMYVIAEGEQFIAIGDYNSPMLNMVPASGILYIYGHGWVTMSIPDMNDPENVVVTPVTELEYEFSVRDDVDVFVTDITLDYNSADSEWSWGDILIKLK